MKEKCIFADEDHEGRKVCNLASAKYEDVSKVTECNGTTDQTRCPLCKFTNT